ncbi:carbohydrate ABC transporter permease [Clostridium sp. NSJ-6]|uniref:Carbohydrate ABC transporter permease n=1 Tax=Clostridium hominis TaxID=2763036 RepID=A0ABR7DJ17_9CLOT|nr:carbohydrate ABC transporter permease [Clostridium hominis]MBC5630828.1 carbohydrate ABC transporter permease [Clostridium hominis]MDU2674272.1 carbohydrate ABC transporter permease [Clostridium sp.]
MAKVKEKKIKEPINWKKELKLAPAYLILFAWVAFTVIIIGWIFAASLSTSREIFKGDVLKFASGFHWENYVTAWKTQNVSIFFMNSLFYATISCVGILLISAPAAYVLSRYTFLGNKTIKTSFVIGMSIPVIMIILPLFSIATKAHLTGNRWLLIILYICLNVPFTTTFLLNFFGSLSKSYEEAAAIDGCSPMKTFWVIMLPLAQPGIITVTIFNFLAVWNEYFLALIFANSDNMKSVGVGLFSMVAALRAVGDYGSLFAAVIIVFLPTFLIYIFLSEKIIAGVTGGGVKG